MKNKLISILLCMTVIAAMAAGCGKQESSDDGAGKTEESTQEGEEDKVFHIGCEATTPGWIQTDDDGNLQGYDYDVWQEIGARTGYEIDYQISEWDGLWSLMESGRLDTVGEQISITPEREEKYVFTEPYAYNVYCLLASADNEELKTMDDLKTGMTISCETNTSDEITVKAINEEFGIELEPMYYDGMSVQDVALGRCDLWPRAETSCYTTIKEVDNLIILGKTNVLETNAYPFIKNERGEKLAKLASDALKEMKEDGTLKKLSEKWFEIDITEKPEDAQ